VNFFFANPYYQNGARTNVTYYDHSDWYCTNCKTKGHSTKVCWAKKKEVPKTFVVLLARVVAQPIEPSQVPIKFPCLFCNKMDHKSIDCPKTSKVQSILQNNLKQIVVPKSPKTQ
jgi:hypothetical protein